MTILYSVMGICALAVVSVIVFKRRIDRTLKEDLSHISFTDELSNEQRRTWIAEEIFQRKEFGIHLMSDNMFDKLKASITEKDSKNLVGSSYNYNVLCDPRY